MENQLKKICIENEDMKEKYYLYCNIKKSLKDRLRVVPMYFPHFSMHDESHSANIIKYLGLLLGKENIEKLSVSDIMMVCMAAYTHDISMSVSYEMIYEKMTSDEWKDILKKYTKSQQEDLAKIAEQLLLFPEMEEKIKAVDIYADVVYIIEENFRSEHAKRSAEEIKENRDLGKLFGIRLKKILAEICRLHGCSVSEIMNLPYLENGIFDDFIHPRFDAALLALGDLLDMDTERFDKTFLNSSTPMLNLSEIHKKKHESLTHFLVKDGMIEIKSNCDSLETYRAMRDWVDWIRQITEYMSIHWSEIAPNGVGIAPYLKQSEILLKGDSKWLEFADLKFEISTVRALDLLAGTSLYTNKYTFIREIIQNAVDATMKRIYLQYLEQNEDEKSEDKFLEWLVSPQINIEDYTVNVTISIEKKKVKMVFEDRGVGISTDDIKRIANVSGKSEEERKFIETMPEFYRPSGTFGIGIQSIFSVAKEFTVITRTESEKTKRIIFQGSQNGKGYITVSDGIDRKSVGTTVVVCLEENYFNQEDLHINDFNYKVYPKEELIYRAIKEVVDNISTQGWIFARRQQETEYVPVIIKCSEEGEQKKISEYKCVFKNKPFTAPNFTFINASENFIEYSYYDKISKCVFNARLYAFENEDTDVVNTYRREPKYGETIFYRNSFVEDDYLRGPESGNDKFLHRLDYNINLLSDNSEKVLNFDRNCIKDNFRLQVDKLIRREIEIMVGKWVTYLLAETPELSPSLAVSIYQAAKQFNKGDDILKIYKNKFEKVEIGGYRNFKNAKKSFKASELIEKTLLFAERYDRKENIKYPNMEDEENKDDKVEVSETSYLKMRAEGCYSHPLNHKIKKRYIKEIRGRIYEVIEAEPYSKQKGDAYQMDSFFKHEGFLFVIFADRRCITAWPEYEKLETYINLGVSTYGAAIEKQIEMKMDSEIKEKMRKELEEKGYIENCCEKYLDAITKSVEYNHNISYILNENENEDRDSLIETYKSLWKEELKLLEDERFKEFTINKIKRIKKDIEAGRGQYYDAQFGGYFAK